MEKEKENPKRQKPLGDRIEKKQGKKVSDSVAEKAGVREETFDFIDEERKRSYAAEKEREKELAEGFGKFFSETDDYITENQAEGKIKTTSKGYGSREAYYKNSSDEYLDRYNAGEKYLMSEGKNAFENTAKGAVNRARSVVGGTAEDIAYMINDYAPWYVPAETVLQNNTAGTIGKKADEQFSLAKNKTGKLGDSIIDFADNTAEILGYSILGPKALNYVLGSSEGFEEYRKQRESGASKDIAIKRALTKAMYLIVSEKAEDYGTGKLFNTISPKLKISANVEAIHKNDTSNEFTEIFFEDFFGEQKEITSQQYKEILQFRNCSYKINIQNGLSYFPENEAISWNVKKVSPVMDKNTGIYYFDVGIHGNPNNVAFSSSNNAMTASPEALAVIIAQDKGYKKGQPVRLLSCSMGKQQDYKDCFAQRLANVLNAPVLAPDDVLFIGINGKISIGMIGEGSMNVFQPHYGILNEKIFSELSNWRLQMRRNRE